MTQFPPLDYIPTASAMDGIAVFMPRPHDEAHEETVEFHCPQCAASTAYSADNGGLTCTFCGYYAPPAQEAVGKAADEFEFTVETMERVAHGWGTERTELSCNRCAARTTISSDMLTHTCPFCGSNQVVQTKAPQDVLRPRFLVPFSVTEDGCREKTAVWLSSTWLAPSELRKFAHHSNYVPIYIPFWTFDADTHADWRAEVAHTKTVTTGHGKNRTTKTVTEWRWESGNAHLNIDDLLVNGSNQVSTILLEQMQGYNLNALTPYDPAFLAGIQAQAYDTGLDEAWATGRGQMREQTRQKCRAGATSSRMRNFSMSMGFSKESWRYILLPLYLATYHYENKPYQVMVNGQNGVIAGQRPVAWKKVIIAMIAALSPSFVLGLIALIIAANDPYGRAESVVTVFGIMAAAAMVAAMVFIGTTLNKASKMGKA